MKDQNNLKEFIDDEIRKADQLIADRQYPAAFNYLERAHVLGQGITYEHTRIHWRMLKVGVKTRNLREIWGQLIRIVGASTKTPLGIYPKGNTGGANVYFFKPLPIPDDLQAILNGADRR